MRGRICLASDEQGIARQSEGREGLRTDVPRQGFVRSHTSREKSEGWGKHFFVVGERRRKSARPRGLLLRPMPKPTGS